MKRMFFLTVIMLFQAISLFSQSSTFTAARNIQFTDTTGIFNLYTTTLSLETFVDIDTVGCSNTFTDFDFTLEDFDNYDSDGLGDYIIGAVHGNEIMPEFIFWGTNPSSTVSYCNDFTKIIYPNWNYINIRVTYERFNDCDIYKDIVFYMDGFISDTLGNIIRKKLNAVIYGHDSLRNHDQIILSDAELGTYPYISQIDSTYFTPLELIGSNQIFLYQDVGNNNCGSLKRQFISKKDNDINEWNTYIYPNPADQYLRFTFDDIIDSDFQYSIVDIRGVTYLEGLVNMKTNGDFLDIDVSKYPDGNYYIILKNLDNPESKVISFIVLH